MDASELPHLPNPKPGKSVATYVAQALCMLAGWGAAPWHMLVPLAAMMTVSEWMRFKKELVQAGRKDNPAAAGLIMTSCLFAVILYWVGRLGFWAFGPFF